ncbi:Density-regulated -like protein [Halotydeus destructor]|nr:Density-regulated -like protein [Halotydeus destructor]
MTGEVELPLGPVAGARYPVAMVYCGECSLPLEYCDYYPSRERCKAWLEKTLPELFQRLYCSEPAAGDEAAAAAEEEGGAAGGGSKRQRRGGKGLVGKKSGPGGGGSAGSAGGAGGGGGGADRRVVGVARASRGKKKYVTVVTGLGAFEVDLKEAAKLFASRFACGSSVTGADEIVIQGDVKDHLFDLIGDKWPEIDEQLVHDLGERKL